jgi:hypothetical protein
MNILILSITINWVYRLYEEYILSFKKYIDIFYNKDNIKIDIYYFNSIDFNIENIEYLFENKELNNLKLNDNSIIDNKYDKIFYSGDISIFNNIYDTIFKKYNLNDIIYYINIEQLSKNSYYKMLRHIDNSIKIIDYSEENILYLNNIYTYYLFPPYFKNFNINLNNKNIDVFSIINNSYRKNIYEQIILNKKYKKLELENIYGFDRDDIFNKTKIYVNIHSSEKHLTMELIRITNLIMRKVIVVSQKSVNIDSLFFKDYIIIFDTIEELNIKINDILEKYNYYYYNLYGNFEEIENKYNEYIKSNINKILLQ